MKQLQFTAHQIVSRILNSESTIFSHDILRNICLDFFSLLKTEGKKPLIGQSFLFGPKNNFLFFSNCSKLRYMGKFFFVDSEFKIRETI